MKKVRYNKKELAKFLIYPNRFCNKYSRGSCYVIAGSKKYPGAAILSSSACQKIGCGYTKLFTTSCNVLSVACSIPSIPVDSVDNFEIKSSTANRPMSFLIGPGFEPDGNTNLDILHYLLVNTNAPIVIDGGALSLLGNKDVIDALRFRSKNGFKTVITPHYGEAKNLYLCCIDTDIPEEKNLAKTLSDFFKSVVVLKGPDTYICDGNKIYKMKSGTSALAKAGSGDVLAGFIAGLLSQAKTPVFESCVLATNLHAMSGSVASKKLSNISTNPNDLIQYLPMAIGRLK